VLITHSERLVIFGRLSFTAQQLMRCMTSRQRDTRAGFAQWARLSVCHGVTWVPFLNAPAIQFHRTQLYARMRWLFIVCRHHRQAVLYSRSLIGQNLFSLFLYAAEVVILLSNMHWPEWPDIGPVRHCRLNVVGGMTVSVPSVLHCCLEWHQPDRLSHLIDCCVIPAVQF